MEELVNSLISISEGPEPVKPKLKLKIKIGLAKKKVTLPLEASSQEFSSSEQIEKLDQ